MLGFVHIDFWYITRLGNAIHFISTNELSIGLSEMKLALQHKKKS